MNPRKRIYVVCAYIEREDGKVLLDQRKSGTHLEHLWEFPGGKLEPGETDQKALSRELEEELGVTSTIGEEIARVKHAYPDFDLELVLYAARIFGTPQALEVAEIGWFDKSELSELPMPPADRPLIDAILALDSQNLS